MPRADRRAKNAGVGLGPVGNARDGADAGRFRHWTGGGDRRVRRYARMTYHFAGERGADDHLLGLDGDVLLRELALRLLVRGFGLRHGGDDDRAAGLDSLAGLGAEAGLRGDGDGKGERSDGAASRVESVRARRFRRPTPVRGDQSTRAYPLTSRINVAAPHRSRGGLRVRTWTAGATAAMADMADMFTRTKDGADGARARRVMPAVRRTPKSAFPAWPPTRESYRQPPAEKGGTRRAALISARMLRVCAVRNVYVV